MEKFEICMYCGLPFRKHFIKDKILITLCEEQQIYFCSMDCYNNYEAEFGFKKEGEGEC